MNASRKPFELYVLVAVLVFQSVSAIIPGWIMISDPSGEALQFPADVLEHAPFKSFLVPGIFLLLCLGLLPLLSVYQLLSKTETRAFRQFNLYRNYRFGWMLSLFCGFATLIWITVQHQFTQTFHWLQTFYAVVGLMILMLTLLPATMRYCRRETLA